MSSSFSVNRTVVKAALLLGLSATALPAASFPSGADGAATLSEDMPYTMAEGNFGFSDPGDNPSNHFSRVKLTTLPGAGVLSVDGEPVAVGEFIPLFPIPGVSWRSAESVRDWRCITSSSDGTRLVAGVAQGQLYVSQDSGISWTARDSARSWQSLASSADGSKLAAAVSFGQIYTSNDAGVSWTARESARNWVSIVSSADGARLAAAHIQGKIYTSTDSGLTWTARGTDRKWRAVASSADGLKLAAAEEDGLIYISSDAGLTWTGRGSARPWRSIASSADGTRLAATANNDGDLYYSTDSGATWAASVILRTPWTIYPSVVSSADGKTLAVSVSIGRIFVSTDGGLTWKERETTRNWSAATLSGDGRTLAASVFNGRILVSAAALPALVFTPDKDQFGPAYTSFTFQVEDDGAPGANLDPSPKTFTFNVAPRNDAPRLTAGRIPDQVAPKNTPFSLTLQAESFTDPDPGTFLTFTATAADGGLLPAWLSFNPGTRTFSGTPSLSDGGVTLVRLTVTDNAIPALSLNTDFSLKVAGQPAGTENAATLLEDTTRTFNAVDFGFSDPADSPPDAFFRVKVTTLPAAGTLTVNDVPVKAGDLVPITPVPGVEWTPRAASSQWRGMASSADGVKLLAAGAVDRLYTSTDAGVTWTPRESVRYWNACASSSDGQKLVAVVRGGRIYTSSDAGVSWVARDGIREWMRVASSADGTKLVATAMGDYIYTSTDSGVTWTPREDFRNWTAVASSADGVRLVATVFGEVYGGIGTAANVYTSSDSGVTWKIGSTVPKFLSTLRCSAEGKNLIGVGDGILALSRNFGESWEVQESNDTWTDAATSDDGRILAVTPYLNADKILTSLDFGATWMENGISGQWTSIASSADGSRLVAGLGNGLLYTSSPSLPVLRYTPPANGSGAPYTSFTFQVQDRGPSGINLDPTPKRFTLNVTNVNDAPILSGTVPAQSAPQHTSFIYQVPAGTFTNNDPGDSLTLTAAQASGNPLPAWLGFNSGTQTLSGTPQNGDTGSIDIRLTATDTGDPPLSASLVFRLTVPGIVPSGTDGAAVINEDAPYIFQAADFGFTDTGDNPPNQFTRVKVTTLPAAGTLTIEGVPVAAGDYVSMFPDSRMVWTAHDSNRLWSAVASSADGTKLVALDQSGQGGRIYISSDSGITWTARESSRFWNGVAMSADGSKLIAAEFAGRLYTSLDSGVTWTPRENVREWTAVTSSADGTRLAAIARTGQVSISTDSGTSWTVHSAPPSLDCLASSSDGLKLVAGTSGSTGGPLYTSTDGGATWTARESARQWFSVASSADGNLLIAAPIPGPLYLSRDSGVTWTARGETLEWQSVASSADGNRLAAVGNGRIHTSTDAGLTWSKREQHRQWYSVASSADGLKLIAGTYQGKLYTSVAQVPQLTFTPAANAFGSSYAGFTFQVEDDGSGGAILDPTPNLFTFDVQSVNDAPVLTAPLSDGSATENRAFSYRIQDNRFTDADAGSVLTYSAAKTDGSPLPSWLAFNPATRTFSGTPGSSDTGEVHLQVTVMDNGTPALSVSGPLYLTVSNVDDPPSGANGNKTIDEDTPYSFTEADFGFSDPGDFRPNTLARVKITTLPSAGILTVDAAPLAAGDFVSMGNTPIWTPRETNRNWYSIASSADGSKLVAAVNNGRLLTSIDAGVTWTQRDSSRAWYHVACSGDGTRLAAVVTGGFIYISSDSGVTWTQRGSSQGWRAISSSADGSKLAAIGLGLRIYTSSDSGLTWTPGENNRNWYSIASSADGSKLVAVVRDGLVYTSSDFGATWTARASARNWRAVTSSADGTKLSAIVSNGQIYTSTDAGLNWTPRDFSRGWYYIASSADGSKLVAVVQNGRIYRSDDAGVTWNASESNRAWRAVASSADGSKLVAVVPDGRIYSMAPPLRQTLAYTPAANSSGSPYSDFTFQVEDDGLQGSNLDLTPKTFTFNVNPVNDPPTLDKVDPWVLPAIVGPQTIQLTGITAGPSESQDLIITAVSSNPSVVPAPLVTYQSPDATGSLSFTPSSDSGSALITVTVTDGGGAFFSRSFMVRHITPFLAWAVQGSLSADPEADGGLNLLRFASGLNADAQATETIQVAAGEILQRGLPALTVSGPQDAQVFKVLFGRRKASGLIYKPQFSADLITWETSDHPPVVRADDGLVEACEIPFPAVLNGGQKPRFFQLAVEDLP